MTDTKSKTNLGTIEFPRIRIGIGKPMENEDKIKFVIGKLSNKTKEKLEKGKGENVCSLRLI